MKVKFKILLAHIPNLSQAHECHAEDVYKTCCAFLASNGWLSNNDPFPDNETLYPNDIWSTLQPIITEAENGRLDVLVIYSFAQLKISASDTFTFMDALLKHNVLICSAKESITSETPVGKLQLYLLTTINEVRTKTLTKSSHELRYEADHVEKLEKVLNEKIGLVLSLTELAEHERHL